MITEEFLKDKVLILLNEPYETQISLITDDTLILDKYIRALLPEAVLFVQMNKSKGVLNCKNISNCEITINSDGKGIIMLPDDYIRLVSLKLDIWKNECYVSFIAGSVMDCIQTNKYMRAGSCTPVCIEGVSSLNERILIVYPVNETPLPIVQSFVYESRYDATEGLVGGTESLVKAVAYECAALLCNVFEKIETANMFHNLAIALCNVNK